MAAQVAGRARLKLEISRQTACGGTVTTEYTVVCLDPSPDVAAPAWRLTQADGSAYDVALTQHGPVCDCSDFVWRRDGRDPKGCKHVAALTAVGLLRRDA